MEKSFKISKYNPSHNNEQLKKEWSSYHDVHKLVSLEDYLFIENEYINTVICVCRCLNIKSLKIKDLECYDDSFDLIENNEIEIDELENVLKLVLRELAWFKLVSQECEFHFGYDYYMYILLSKDFILHPECVSDRLFIESFKSPYL